jgi:hypothetical protein
VAIGWKVSKIEQTAIKFTNIFHCKTLQNLPKLGFLFENIPSGSPAGKRTNVKQKSSIQSYSNF